MPEGTWRAVATPTTLRRSGAQQQRGLRQRTVADHPQLAARVAAMPARVRRRLDPVPDPEQARLVGNLADAVSAAGGRALVVGGAVRDAVIAAETNRPLVGKDVDIEVFGLAAGQLETVLSRFGHPDLTGRQFAVFKLGDLDVSLPRTEVKDGAGHRGFTVVPDPSLPPERAAARRDFTCNAISFDPRSGELVDPAGGVGDLRAGLLRHVSEAFDEDPLRVLRAAQFLSRFELTVAPATAGRCRQLVGEADTLPAERRYEEWRKLLSGRRPGAGVHFLDQVGWLAASPPLGQLRQAGQLASTAAALDRHAARRPDDVRQAQVVALATLCHRLPPPGNWQRTAAGTGEQAARFVSTLTNERGLASQVRRTVAHLPVAQRLAAANAQVPDHVLLGLAERAGRLDRLVELAAAAGDEVTARWLAATADRMGVLHGPADPLLRGQDLLDAGLEPGPRIGQLLGEVARARRTGRIRTRQQALQLALAG